MKIRKIIYLNCGERYEDVIDNMYLLTEQGRTGKYLSLGQDVRTERRKF